MATSAMNTVMQQLRRTVMPRAAAETSDGQLLESFINRNDEAAFHTLVQRHGPMVWGVCRRLLHNRHDAEDAFQATFLVFVRKASSVRPRTMVGNWLHGVAYRTALKTRAVAARRQRREKQMTEALEPAAAPGGNWSDLRGLLDQELSHLPAKYRLPIILCDIEGRSIKEATLQLGWPQGTLAGRLVRARVMLAKRLSRRGITLSGGALAMMLSEHTASACVPFSLAVSTSNDAAMFANALTQGVLKAMFLSKLKVLAAALIAVTVISAGIVLLPQRLSPRALAQESGPQGKPSTVQQPFRSETIPGTQIQRLAVASPGQDEAKLHGEWVGDNDGAFSLIFGPNDSMEFIAQNGRHLKGKYSVDWSKQPHHLDGQWQQPAPERSFKTIIEFTKNGGLRFQFDASDDATRPKKFTAASLVLARKKKPADAQQLDAAAARDFEAAEFYRHTGHFGSACFCYQLIERRYPDSPHAKRAADSLAELNKLRIRLPDGSEGWPAEAGEKQPPAPLPVILDITPPQAEALLEQALGEKGVVAGFPIKLLSRSMFVATKALSIEKDGRVRLDALRGIIFGKDKNAEATLVVSDGALVTFDEAIDKIADLGSRKIVRTQFVGNAEMRTVNLRLAEKGAREARVGQIIIVGNDKTPDSAILSKIPIYPGEALDYQSLRTAEKNLRALNATASVIDSDGEFKDILINVKEE